jgi:formiminotetrahydrofolate cyclodeaminase
VNAIDRHAPVRFGSLPLDAFVEQLVSAAPTPGGGSGIARRPVEVVSGNGAAIDPREVAS